MAISLYYTALTYNTSHKTVTARKSSCNLISTIMVQREQQKHLGVGESGEPGEEGESKHPRGGRHEHGIHAACFRGRWQPVARHRADEAPRVTGEGHRGEGREGGEVNGAVEEEADPLQLQEMARRRVVATTAATASGQAGLRGGAR